MADRYYLTQPVTAGTATLGGAEAHHLLHVMRARVGDQVTLFDGQGSEYSAQIEQCGRSEVQLSVGKGQQVCREPAINVTLGVALPKGDRQKWLVEKLTELGTATLVPLTTERSVVDPRGKSLQKLERVVVEACKQCGRNRLMTIEPTQTFDRFIASASGTKLLAHPAGESLATLRYAAGEIVTAVVGPEGGFSETEVELALANGWHQVDLGTRILRIETAAVALAAVLTFQGE